MATLRDIQRRIRAVKNTRQITKAMKMVAAAKLRKAQQRMLELRPYADKMDDVIKSLAAGADTETHPLLAVRSPRVVEVVVMTSDKGLCGAFNSNILRAAGRLLTELAKTEVDSVSGGPIDIRISPFGKKAVSYYKRRETNTLESWSGLSGSISFRNAQDMANSVMERFISGEVDEVHIVYNEFVNVVKQEVKAVKLLPAAAPEASEREEKAAESADFIYEPTEEELLGQLLPKNIEVQVFRALLESQASEEAARMTSMENATKSANEMIDRLTLQYNKARQASITAELMDIVGGVEALKQG